PPDIIRTVDSPFPDPDGFRLLWFHSNAKEQRDGEDRRERITRAVGELEELKARVEGPRSRLKGREGIAEKADRILAHRGVQRWLRYSIEETRLPKYRQEKRGRAGAQTRWRRSVDVRQLLSWEAMPRAIEEDARCDGVFPLLSNCSELSIKEILEAYKRKHPLIEKRHEMLKSVLATTPVFLKNIGRVEALLFMEFIAMTVHALVEREIRHAMQREGITKLYVRRQLLFPLDDNYISRLFALPGGGGRAKKITTLFLEKQGHPPDSSCSTPPPLYSCLPHRVHLRRPLSPPTHEIGGVSMYHLPLENALAGLWCVGFITLIVGLYRFRLPQPFFRFFACSSR
ncbi:MAG: hypothetical protein V1800_06710, partial [Candidatus Latescibacterota bacterium]